MVEEMEAKRWRNLAKVSIQLKLFTLAHKFGRGLHLLGAGICVWAAEKAGTAVDSLRK